MSGINDTAYPQLRTEISDQDLISAFTPSATERRFIANAYRRATTQALIAVQLKMLQRLGYFVTMDIVPNAVIKHICKHYRVQPFSTAMLQRYDQSGSKSLHQRRLREFVGLRLLDADAQDWLEGEAVKAAQTKATLNKPRRNADTAL
jgi:hypothetical protein